AWPGRQAAGPGFTPRAAAVLGDTSVVPVQQLVSAGEALEREGRTREAAEAFQDAARWAHLQGDAHFAVSLVGRAAMVKDSAFAAAVNTRLAASPLLDQERDLEKESAFIGQARQIAAPLRIRADRDVAEMIQSAADAQAVLEDLASAGR